MSETGKINSIEELEQIYKAPGEAATLKVTSFLTPAYKTWIERSRFCIISTVGPEGTDASPRGDEGPVVRIQDHKTILMPDWMGNNRIDTLRNIVRDERASLMFMINGANNVIRTNGRAYISTHEELLQRFEFKGKLPRSVIVFTVEEVYSQCARALIRSQLWTSVDQANGLPTVGQMLAEISKGDFDGKTYDATWHERAQKTMW
jgi:PPOX class probable FMN-dependent enzyme